MGKITDGTKVAPHGLFYLEEAGGIAPEPPPPPVGDELQPDEHKPSCFALEEEMGEGWHGVGAMKPLVKDARPTL